MKYRFFFHYNKPESRKQGIPIITVHYKGQCIPVKNIVCEVPTEGKLRKTQPRFVMQGWTNNLIVKNGVAYVK